MGKLLVIGAGGHGHVVAESAQALGFEVSFLDDNNPEAIGKIEELGHLLGEYDSFFVAIGNNSLRKKITENAEQLGGKIATLIHPSAYVSPTASIAPGTIVAPKAVVNARSMIGEGCILSVGAIVDHDVIVEPFAHINAGSICTAGSRIEAGRKLEAGEVVFGY